MHLCFIIDNSLPLLHKTWGNASGLDYIKSCIESMLREVSRNGSVIREHQIVHLFATSNPKAPLSSFQHDTSHFNYQLKSIECRPITFPAQTILLALKHIGKFRTLTETETILGYREGTVYQAAMVFLFTSSLTLQKISKIEFWLPKFQMRSEYKFLMFQLCLSSKNQKVETIKAQVEGSVQYKQLNKLMQKLNKGQIRNIYRGVGRESLLDTLIKLLGIYRPNLCVDFRLLSSEGVSDRNFDFFTHSELNLGSIFGEDHNLSNVKVFLVPILGQHRHRNQIPLPQKIKVRQTDFDIEVDQIFPPKFIIDLTKKLTQPVIDRIPFESYKIMTNMTISKLQKQVSRSNLGNIFFPVYQQTLSQSLIPFGLLRINPPNQTELLITYGNFPLLVRIVSALETRKTYADNKKIQIMLKQYTSSIPDFYLKFIHNFFSYRFGIDIPETNPHNRMFALNKKIQMLRMKDRKKMVELGEENLRKHQTNTSICCPIYSQNYKQFSRNISKYNKNQNHLNLNEAVFTNILQRIGEVESKYKIDNYFSVRSTEKCVPVIQELEKYSGRRGEQDFFNQNIGMNLGNPYKKKKTNTCIEQLAQDTPMMPYQNFSPQVEEMLQVDKALYESKLAVEMKQSNKDESTDQLQQINYAIEDGNEGEAMQEESRKEGERPVQDLQMVDEDQLNMLEQINESVRFEVGKKMVLNVKNLRAQTHEENLRKLKQMGMIS